MVAPTQDLTITGNLDLDGTATNLATLTVSGASDLGANVETTGIQTYNDAVTLSSDVILTAPRAPLPRGWTAPTPAAQL